MIKKKLTTNRIDNWTAFQSLSVTRSIFVQPFGSFLSSNHIRWRRNYVAPSWNRPRSVHGPNICHASKNDQCPPDRLACHTNVPPRMPRCLPHTWPSVSSVSPPTHHHRADGCPSSDPECMVAGTVTLYSPTWGNLQESKQEKKNQGQLQKMWTHPRVVVTIISKFWRMPSRTRSVAWDILSARQSLNLPLCRYLLWLLLLLIKLLLIIIYH